MLNFCVCNICIHKVTCLVKGETLVKDTFASWKKFQIYGNKLFQKPKFLNQG